MAVLVYQLVMVSIFVKIFYAREFASERMGSASVDPGSPAILRSKYRPVVRQSLLLRLRLNM